MHGDEIVWMVTRLQPGKAFARSAGKPYARQCSCNETLGVNRNAVYSIKSLAGFDNASLTEGKWVLG